MTENAQTKVGYNYDYQSDFKNKWIILQKRALKAFVTNNYSLKNNMEHKR